MSELTLSTAGINVAKRIEQLQLRLVQLFGGKFLSSVDCCGHAYVRAVVGGGSSGCGGG